MKELSPFYEKCPFYKKTAKTKSNIYNDVCLFPENYSPDCWDTNFCFFRIAFTTIDRQFLERIQRKAKWWGFEELPDRAMLNFCEKNKDKTFRAGKPEHNIGR